LVGVFALSLKETTLDRILFVLLSFSAGSILGTAFLDLLPEAVALIGEEQLSITFFFVTLGFLGFFFLERFIYWFHGHVHGHESKSEVDERITIKKFVYLNLIGDATHNLIDGMIIAASFLVNTTVGLTTTVAVFFHELPQEIGDFGVLVYGGFKRYRALLFNFLSALTAIVGAIISNYFSIHVENFVGFLMAFAAGSFVFRSSLPRIAKLAIVLRRNA
jgi:zinc and cadmium transporter